MGKSKIVVISLFSLSLFLIFSSYLLKITNICADQEPINFVCGSFLFDYGRFYILLFALMSPLMLALIFKTKSFVSLCKFSLFTVPVILYYGMFAASSVYYGAYIHGVVEINPTYLINIYAVYFLICLSIVLYTKTKTQKKVTENKFFSRIFLLVSLALAVCVLLFTEYLYYQNNFRCRIDCGLEGVYDSLLLGYVLMIAPIVLISFFVAKESFDNWLKFSVFAVPIFLVYIYFMVTEVDKGWFGITYKMIFTPVIYLAYLIISLAIIAYTSYKLRKVGKKQSGE